MAISTAPDSYFVYSEAAWVEALSGNIEDASSLLEEAEARVPSKLSTPPNWRLLGTYVSTGRHDAADRELKKLIAQGVGDGDLFFTYLSLGMLDKALDHAHSAADKAFPAVFISNLAPLWSRPFFQPLHGNTRFIELLSKLGVNVEIK